MSQIQTMNVTPEMAKQWLANTPEGVNFRHVQKKHVSRLAADMANRAWEFNGESVKLNCDGSVVDGQHRLLACIEANVGFMTVVVSGVTSDLNIDTGKKRSVGDYLERSGHVNCNALAAAARKVWAWQEGLCMGRYVQVPSNSQLIRLVNDHPGLCEYVQIAKGGLFPPSEIASVTYVGSCLVPSKCSVDVARNFAHKVNTGEMISSEDACFHLRNRILKAKKTKLTQIERVALTIKAWNAHKYCTPVVRLAWHSSGKKTEQFPEIK